MTIWLMVVPWFQDFILFFGFAFSHRISGEDGGVEVGGDHGFGHGGKSYLSENLVYYQDLLEVDLKEGLGISGQGCMYGRGSVYLVLVGSRLQSTNTFFCKI